MILSHRVALNGVQLDSVDHRILVQGVDESAGKDQLSAVSVFGGVGQRVTNRHRDYLDVTVRFSLKIKKNDMQARSDVFERVNAWAAPGGWLSPAAGSPLRSTARNPILTPCPPLQRHSPPTTCRFGPRSRSREAAAMSCTSSGAAGPWAVWPPR